MFTQNSIRTDLRNIHGIFVIYANTHEKQIILFYYRHDKKFISEKHAGIARERYVYEIKIKIFLWYKRMATQCYSKY